jgi:hypothetical protein
MQARRWTTLYRLVNEVAVTLSPGSRRFADRIIVLVLLWAAFHHKPISWAVQRRNWPAWMQRLLPTVPSSTTMSRRLRRESVRVFLDRLLERVQGPLRVSLVRVVDGTALEIRGHSKDRQAGYGFGSGRKAKGYKLHLLLDSAGVVVQWLIAPMNVNEKRMALRMILKTDEMAYLVADGEYDANSMHRAVSAKGGQLVAPRRADAKKLGHRRQAPGRLRSQAMLEGPSPFGRELLRARSTIERFFGNADSHSEALGELPAWVRTHRRVRTWVHAKLVINAVRVRLLRESARAA